MQKSAHAHSALIQNGQFCARIARKECGHFNEVGRKLLFGASKVCFEKITSVLKVCAKLQTVRKKYVKKLLVYQKYSIVDVRMRNILVHTPY